MKLKKNTTKIYVTLAVWAFLTVGMFVYGFKIVENSNTQAQAKLDTLNSELSALQAERDSFNKAKKDLDTLASKDMQPEDFYSKDTTLVNEIRFFEGLADRVGIKMQLSGPSGTSQTAPKAKSLSGEIILVPLNISVSGPFPKVLEFAQAMENLPFATQTNGFTLSTLSATEVSANFVGSFYLRK
ncbi:MAG: hypothetical protein M1333_02960 [Patescibacteria group bacterium]|nr:hypothetical protein [Patescibacteria group bacterium]